MAISLVADIVGADDHHHAHADVGAGHPPAMPTGEIDHRRPEELQGPGQAEQTEQADLGEFDALLAKMHREQVEEQAERKTLGKIQQADPEQFRAQQFFRRIRAAVRAKGRATDRAAVHGSVSGGAAGAAGAWRLGHRLLFIFCGGETRQGCRASSAAS
jgi:hypothetical protein